MRTSSVARRYAKALIEIGKEEKAYEKYGKELRTVLGVFAGNPELEKFLLNPMHRLEERKAVMAKVAVSHGLSAYVSKFLEILVETRKIRSLDAIIEAYGRYEDALVGRIRAVIESPSEPDTKLLESIKEKLKGSTGKDVILSYQQNPALIGGIVVRIGNTILDGSIKTQLELMKEKILEGVV